MTRESWSVGHFLRGYPGVMSFGYFVYIGAIGG